MLLHEVYPPISWTMMLNYEGTYMMMSKMFERMDSVCVCYFNLHYYPLYNITILLMSLFCP